MSASNNTGEKRKRSEVMGVVLIRIAAFAFAMVSWKATADGLSKYVFGSSGWQSGLVSFAIQTILFVFNLKLPFYFEKIGELASDREKKKYHFGAKKGKEKRKFKITAFQRVIIGFYCTILLSSSFFSFIYICDYVVYEHQSGYVDDDILLTSSYRKVLHDTYRYMKEEIKAKQVLASKILGELNKDYSSESKESKNLSKQQLIEAVSIAQDAYDIAKVEYNEAVDMMKAYNNEMDSYASSRNGTTWHDRQDEWEQKYIDAKAERDSLVEDMKSKKTVYRAAKNELTQAKNALENYKDSKEKIISDFLLEMLKASPDSDALEQHISDLNSRITELGTGTNSNLVENYSELVGTTQTLTTIVKDYLSLAEASSGENGINAIMKHLADKIVIPNPNSKSFEEEYFDWKEAWQLRLDNLEDLIQNLPGVSISEKEKIGSTVIDIEFLEKYNIDEKMNTLDELRRNKVSDINIIEKVWSLLFGKYWGIAWFSLGLAVFFDVSSLLAGLFIYAISKKKIQYQRKA